LALEHFAVVAIHGQLVVEAVVELGAMDDVHIAHGNHAAQLRRMPRDGSALRERTAAAADANRRHCPTGIFLRDRLVSGFGPRKWNGRERTSCGRTFEK